MFGKYDYNRHGVHSRRPCRPHQQHTYGVMGALRGLGGGGGGRNRHPRSVGVNLRIFTELTTFFYQ